MRLIDADALDDVIQTLNEKNWGITRADYKMIDAVLFEFPTIEERKKEEWIVVHDDVFADTYYCSECKEPPLCDGTKYILSDFCPNCGADMRESNKLLNNCSKCRYGKNYLNNMWWCEKHDMMKNREGESCSDFKNK